MVSFCDNAGVDSQYLQSSKVDNAVNLGMSSKHFFEGGLVADVYLVEIWSFSGDQLDTIKYYFGGVVETVDDNDLVAML